MQSSPRAPCFEDFKPYLVRMEKASKTNVAVISAMALNANDQWTPINAPSMPTVTPLKERMPLNAM